MNIDNRRSPSIRGLKMQLEEIEEEIQKRLQNHNYTGALIQDLEYQIDIINELIAYKEKYEKNPKTNRNIIESLTNEQMTKLMQNWNSLQIPDQKQWLSQEKDEDFWHYFFTNIINRI